MAKERGSALRQKFSMLMNSLFSPISIGTWLQRQGGSNERLSSSANPTSTRTSDRLLANELDSSNAIHHSARSLSSALNILSARRGGASLCTSALIIDEEEEDCEEGDCLVHTITTTSTIIATNATNTALRPEDMELVQAFRLETKRKIEALKADHKAAFHNLKEQIYGDSVCHIRKNAADQLVICGDRDAMLLAFLTRKQFNVEVTLNSLLRILQWRIDADIENVFEETRLEKEKIEKHRKYWPTAYYEKDNEGYPIFVDRLELIDLYGLKKADPVALDMDDMVINIIQWVCLSVCLSVL